MANPFEAVIVVAPEKNLTAKEDEKLAKSWQLIRLPLSEEELEKLVTATRELKEYQDTPSTPEILAKIPLLKREDIEKRQRHSSGRKRRGWHQGAAPQLLYLRDRISKGAV